MGFGFIDAHSQVMNFAIWTCTVRYSYFMKSDLLQLSLKCRFVDPSGYPLAAMMNNNGRCAARFHFVCRFKRAILRLSDRKIFGTISPKYFVATKWFHRLGWWEHLVTQFNLSRTIQFSGCSLSLIAFILIVESCVSFTSQDQSIFQQEVRL